MPVCIPAHRPRHFISNDMPVNERRPHHILPFAASITREVMIPRMWFHDPQLCRRMYVVNFRDGMQTIYLLEGFGESYDCRQNAPDPPRCRLATATHHPA